ncbi:hypothetical protein PLICRDRAFT_157876 [Plicaturopsis crispa FD-325 SS-3]|nr:hypothetical protein PLICRDRAFT_157876 [Plicaturopsis crispa FD-325 SS-3]
MLSRSFLRSCCTRPSYVSGLRLSSSSARESCANHALVEMLSKHLHEEEQNPYRNMYKVRAFGTAIKTLEQLDHPIRTKEEAKVLKGIGPGIAKRIDIFLSGQPGFEKATKAESLATRRRRAVANLQMVSGIGKLAAQKLVDAGCMTVEELQKNPEWQAHLTIAQKIGLKYHAHLQESVTREETETVAAFIRDNISSKFEVHITGAYRRGAPTSEDIDIVLFHPSHVHVPTPSASSKIATTNRGRQTIAFRTAYTRLAQRSESPLLQEVVEPLRERGLMADTLSCGVRKWQGVVMLPEQSADPNNKWGERGARLKRIRDGKGVYRRMDLSIAPLKSRGAAMIALTGDVEFNKDLRKRASDLGMHLNEFGLWRWRGDAAESADGEHEGESEKGYWELVRAETEDEIMKEVGMDYIEPERRNFAFLNAKPVRGRGKPRKSVG